MKQQDKLGRGLDALFGDTVPELSRDDLDNVRMVPIEMLFPGKFQPRFDIDETAIEELASSIKAHGIIQPIIARELGSRDGYEIVAGERRWRAAQRCALHDVPVIVRSLPDQSAMAMALIENIQREDLNPVEEAVLLKRLVDEFSMKHSEIAETIGKSRATVTNLLRLLALPESVLDMLKAKQIETGHAKVLLSLAPEHREPAARYVVKHSLSVRAAEVLVKNWPIENKKDKSTVTRNDANITELENELSERLESKVSIHNIKGKGFIKIKYQNLDEFDAILCRIRGN